MKTFIKVLWVIAGVALMIGGCFAILEPLKAMNVFEIACGISFIVSGVSGIVAYIASHRVLFGAGWVLAEGILSTLLGCLLLLSKLGGGIIAGEYASGTVFSVFVGTIIGLWLMFFGVNALTRSFDLHALGAKGWGWSTLWGIICILVAVGVFSSPIVSAVTTVSFLMGVSLMIGGVGMIARCFSRDIED